MIEASDSLLHAPSGAQIAQHNSTPFARTNRGQLTKSGPPRGILYNSQQEWSPPLPTSHLTGIGSRWKAFAEASAYPHISAEGSQIVSEDWLQQNGADYSRPWLAGEGDGDAEKGAGLFRFTAKRRVWYVRAQRTILRNPIIPMIIRLNVWSYSAVALALAASIHHITDKTGGINPTPSTDMAIIVDAVAMVYLLFITWDEYSGKPLGLRPAKAKMRLIFLDLFFIVFDSANLSLAFEAIRSKDDCKISSTKADQHAVNSDIVCDRQRALASVLLIALIAWLLTFAISVLRLGVSHY